MVWLEAPLPLNVNDARQRMDLQTSRSCSSQPEVLLLLLLA